jgi:polysaccharide biosynthesis/export protein
MIFSRRRMRLVCTAILMVALGAQAQLAPKPSEPTSSNNPSTNQSTNVPLPAGQPTTDASSPEDNQEREATQPQTTERVPTTRPDVTPLRNETRKTAVQEVPRTPVQTAFGKLVSTSVGKIVPIFGMDLFTKPLSTYAPTDVSVTADYLLGPGDEVVVRVWAGVDIDHKGFIDRGGDYFLPKVGSIHLAGVQYSELNDVVRNAIARYFHDFKVQASMGQLRSVRVFVAGQAQKPGAYTVSSLSTLVNALFFAGGPLPTGSMRQIQLKRAGKVVSEFDLYDLLLKGDTSNDVRLQASDVIFIPPVGPEVAVVGAVKTNAIFELKGSTTVGDLVNMAGGADSVAEMTTGSLERIDGHRERSVESIVLDAAGLQRPVKDGDLLKVRDISPKFSNAVILTGHVSRPGMYPWKQGMTLKDLLPTAESFVGRRFWELRNRVPISGEIMPDLNRLYPDIDWDYAVIERQDPATLKSLLIPFKPRDVLAGGESVALQPNDVVRIFSQGDVDVPLKERTRYVKIEGEVLRPGVYMVDQSETLKSLVDKAGGLTSQAYLFGAGFFRESVRAQQQAALDAMITKLQGESATPTRGTPSAALSDTDSRTVRTDVVNASRKQRLANELKAVPANGRIAFRLSPTSSIEDLPLVELQDGDRFAVPSIPSDIMVMGAVQVNASFIFQNGRSAAEYLRLAGGATKNGDSKRAFVIRANGAVASANGMFKGGIAGVDAMPGDVVVVPVKEGLPFSEGLKDWGQILSGFGLTAASLAVIAKQ